MSKQEFIDRLRAALNGRVAPGVVMENVNFYEDYINTELRKGRDEAEILQTLGDPRLIARTIIDTYDKENGGEQIYEYEETGYENSDGWRTSEQDSSWEDYGQKQQGFRIKGWMWLIILLVIVVLVISFIFSVVSFLLPILLPVLVVVFLVKLFRDWLN